MRVVNVAIAPLISKDFSVVGRLVIVDDITERVELEAQLAQADKMSSIGLLAAGVAHEVNTPLAVISSYAQLLAKQLQGDEKRSELLDKITKQTFRASEIVNNLLNFSRTSGTEFGNVDLNRIIQDTLALLEHQFKTARIRVVGELQPSLPQIHGNQGKLQQVFLNLFPECQGCDAAGRNLDGSYCAWSRRARACHRHWNRHRSRAYSSYLRSILYHEDAAQTGRQRRHRAGAGSDLRNYSGARRQDSRGEQPRRRHQFLMEFPMSRKAIHV